MSEELNFGHAHRVRMARRCLLRSTDACVDAIGMETAVAASGARRQDLRDALSDREGRRFDVEWAWSIALVAPAELRIEVAKCLVEPFDLGVAPIRPLTDAEKLARLEYRVASQFGAAGAALVEGNRR